MSESVDLFDIRALIEEHGDNLNYVQLSALHSEIAKRLNARKELENKSASRSIILEYGGSEEYSFLQMKVVLESRYWDVVCCGNARVTQSLLWGAITEDEKKDLAQEVSEFADELEQIMKEHHIPLENVDEKVLLIAARGRSNKRPNITANGHPSRMMS